MKLTDETPNITPDEDNQDANAPLPGIEPGPSEIAEGIETDPDVPGQPEKPDVVGGI